MDAFWIILTGALVAVSCSLLGCFLILRKMSMVSDAISHAVLPGIVAAFLLTGSRDSAPLLIGAALVGVLSTFMIDFFHRKGHLQSDAAIGVTFTALFALGVIMLSAYAGQVDIDQDCVLYGEISYTSLNRWITVSGTDMGPYPVWVMGAVLLINLLFISFFYKELLVTTFDPAFSAALGISTVLWHYLLMGLVSLTTVASFDSVGAILVVAFLITPPSTAYILTDDLKKMLWLSAFISVLTSISGYFLAVAVNGSVAGAMSVCAGLLFVLAFLFSPSGGWITKRLKKRAAAPLPE